MAPRSSRLAGFLTEQLNQNPEPEISKTNLINTPKTTTTITHHNINNIMANTAFNEEISYMTLFPDTEFNNITEAYSVYGAGAFFVALMDIAGSKISKVPAGLSLKDRRPDLWALPITQANIDNEQPYLVTVNQLLGKLVDQPDHSRRLLQYAEKVSACLQVFGINLFELGVFFTPEFKKSITYTQLKKQYLCLDLNCKAEELKLWLDSKNSVIIANKLGIPSILIEQELTNSKDPLDFLAELQLVKSSLTLTSLSLTDFLLIHLSAQKKEFTDAEKSNFKKWFNVTCEKISETQKSYEHKDAAVIPEKNEAGKEKQKYLKELNELLYKQWTHELAVFLGLKDNDTFNLLNGFLGSEDSIQKKNELFLKQENSDKLAEFILPLLPYLILVDKLNLDDLGIYTVGKFYLPNKEQQLNPYSKEIALDIIYFSKLWMKLSSPEDKNKLISYACDKDENNRLSGFFDLFAWPTDDAEIYYTNHQLYTDPGLAALKVVCRVYECFEKSKTFKLKIYHIDELIADVSVTDGNVDLYKELQVKEHPLHSKFRPFWGKILEIERDVLVESAIASMKSQFEDIDKPDHLSDYLLIDVEMQGEMNITPLREATDAVQTYLSRCKNGLEKVPEEALKNIDAKDWHWIASFRIWQAEQILKTFPENYLQSAVRSTATDQFKKVIDALRSNELTKKQAENAVLKYLDEWVDLMNAPIVEVEECKTNSSFFEGKEAKTIFLVSKSAVKTNTFNFCYRDECGNQIHWEQWKEIPVNINAKTVSAIFAFNRWHIFWNEHSEIKDTDPSDKDKKFTTYHLSTKCIYQNIDDSWSDVQTIVESFPYYIETDSTSDLIHWGHGKFLNSEAEKKGKDKILEDIKKLFHPNNGAWEKPILMPNGRDAIKVINGPVLNSRHISPEIEIYTPAISQTIKEVASIVQLYATAQKMLEARSYANNWAVITPIQLNERLQVPIEKDFKKVIIQEADEFQAEVTLDILESSQQLHTFRYFIRASPIKIDDYIPQSLSNTVNEKRIEAHARGLTVLNVITKNSVAKLDKSGSFNLYYREMFFHIPMAVAGLFVNDLQYDEARKWYHYVYNALGVSSTDKEAAQKVWKFAPFKETAKKGEQDLQCIDPDLLAESDLSIYKRWTVMRYIHCLLDAADHEFRKGTWEGFSAATQLYFEVEDLLGQTPVVKDKMAELTKPNKTRTYDKAKFETPTNPQLKSAWDRVSDRLFKLRNGLNINGERQMPSLYGTAIDPARLLFAARNGGINPYDETSLQAVRTLYRFRELVPQVESMLNLVVEFGNQLYSALLQNDNEHMQVLQATHQLNMQKAIEQVYHLQVNEASQEVKMLELGKSSAEHQAKYYQDLIEQGNLLTEVGSMTANYAAAFFQTKSAVVRGVASGLHWVPTIFGLANGGIKPGDSAEAAASVLGELGMASQTLSQILATHAEHTRREEEWKFQKDMAEISLKQAEASIESAKIRLEIAKENMKQYKLSVAQANEVFNYLTNKFTNAELYSWMSSHMSSLYFSAYQLALGALYKLQAAFEYELDVAPPAIPNNSWNSLKKGLLAGETLKLALARMNDAYLTKNVRRQEIEKIISLKQLLNGTWENDKKNGSLKFNLDKAALKIANSDSRILKIKSIAVSIPAVLGPYETFGATLTHTQTGQVITISRGIDDMGVFPEEMNDGRYLPFEGIKLENEASGDWVFAVDETIAAKISDVILTVKITAK